jgi:putative membrane protein
MDTRKSQRAVWMLFATALVATAWSAWHPVDYATWAFELLPGSIATAVLLWLAFSGRFQFTAIVYAICAVQFVVLACGAKYTYADMPLFNWLRDVLHLSRNHFDRVGHFLQGVSPALVARELLLRQTNLRRRWVAGFLGVCVALAFSAFYEIVEWQWVVFFYPNKGPDWLGMQGDLWDAQGDMLMALCGAITAVAVLASWQDRELQQHDNYPSPC